MAYVSSAFRPTRNAGSTAMVQVLNGVRCCS